MAEPSEQSGIGVEFSGELREFRDPETGRQTLVPRKFFSTPARHESAHQPALRPPYPTGELSLSIACFATSRPGVPQFPSRRRDHNLTAFSDGQRERRLA